MYILILKVANYLVCEYMRDGLIGFSPAQNVDSTKLGADISCEAVLWVGLKVCLESSSDSFWKTFKRTMMVRSLREINIIAVME